MNRSKKIVRERLNREPSRSKKINSVLKKRLNRGQVGKNKRENVLLKRLKSKPNR